MARPERPVDPADGVVARFAVELRELRRGAGNPGYRELARRAHYAATTLAQASRGDRLPSLPVTLAFVGACGGDPAGWEARWRAAADELEPPAALEDDPDSAPYVGLAAFGPEDRDRFFGRAELTARLVDLVSRRRLVTVIGASGSGKSSLLRAGLLPAVTGSAGWASLIMTPGAHPLRECAVVLGAELGVPASRLGVAFDDQPANLGLAARQFLAQRPDRGELLLIVDQFEEVFTLCADEAERERFIAALTTATEHRVRVVLGMRADFYGRCAPFPELVADQVLVGPMSTDELREVIGQPAVRAGCTVETALVARLTADAANQPGVLPLLSHALLQTWHRRRGNTLTLAGYQAAGGIQRAVARTAEHAYAALDPHRQRLARNLLLRLAVPGDGTEDTKRLVRRDELDNDDPDTALVLEHLAAARLITIGENGVELTHEALIRSWPRFRDWLEDDRDGLRIHRQLTDATTTWQSLDRDPGALYRGTRLALTQDWAAGDGTALTPREREFLRTSLAAQTREQATVRRRTNRLRQLVALLLVLLVVASGATFLAVRAQRTATEQRDTAVANEVLREASALRAENPALALQLTLAAYRLHPSLEARNTLYEMFATPYATRLTGPTRTAWGVAVSPDGRTLAVASLDQTTRLWDVTDPIRPRELPGLSSMASTVVWSPDGHLLVAADPLGTTQLWDLTDRTHPHRLATLADDQNIYLAGQGGVSAAFDHDGKVLVTAHRDGTARLWDIADPGQPHVLASIAIGAVHGSGITVAFGGTGYTLATVGSDGTLRLWDVSDPRAPRLLPKLPDGAGDGVFAEAISPDGRTLATTHNDTTQLWDLADPANPRRLAEFSTTATYTVAFSPDGNTFATAGDNGTTHLWNLADPRHPKESLPLTGHAKDVVAVTFSPDGHTLVTGSLDATVRLTDISQRSLSGPTGDVYAVAFSADGRTLASTTADRGTHLLDVTDPRRPNVIANVQVDTGALAEALDLDHHLLATVDANRKPHVWDISSAHPVDIANLPVDASVIAFSPNGKLVVTADDKGITRLWDVTDPSQPTGLTDLPPDTDFRLFARMVTFSPDSRFLATVGSQAGMQIWDVTDPRRPTAVNDLGEFAISIAFSPDGHTLVTATFGKAIQVWDLADPRHPRRIATVPTVPTNGFPNSFNAATLAFSPDGHSLAIAADDRTTQLWDLTDPSHPTEIAAIPSQTGVVHALAFSPDGNTLATATDNHTVQLWESSPERLAAHICEIAYPRLTSAQWSQYLPNLRYQPPCA